MSRLLCLLVALLLGSAPGCAAMRAENPKAIANRIKPAVKVDAQWWSEEANMNSLDSTARDELLAAIQAEISPRPITEKYQEEIQPIQQEGEALVSHEVDLSSARARKDKERPKQVPRDIPPIDEPPIKEPPPVAELDETPQKIIVGTDALPIDAGDTTAKPNVRVETTTSKTSTYQYAPQPASDNGDTVEVPRVKVKALMEDGGGRHAAIVEIDSSGTHVCHEGDTVALSGGRRIEIRKITKKNVVFGLSGSAKEYVIQ